MPPELIRTESQHRGQVVWVTLGPPPGNLITDELVAELSRALDDAAAAPETKVVVITGAGTHFSYGASIAEHRPGAIERVLPRFHDFIGRLLEYPVPTIAAVSGRCFGAGAEIAISCSIILCDHTAEFGLPEIRLGVFPPVASVLLPRLIGRPAAMRFILGGRAVSAQAVYALGVSPAPADPGTLPEEVDRFIDAHLIDKSASALRFANRAARCALAAHYRRTIPTIEKIYLEEMMKTEDAHEGVAAFIEKRRPEWKNR
jgi:cyclohexa-1,5-dienecarbonyl-CoA hydratase